MEHENQDDYQLKVLIITELEYQVGNRLKSIKAMCLLHVNMTDIRFANRRQMLMITVDSHNRVRLSSS